MAGSVLSSFLYSSITLVHFNGSGYWFSSMALLKSRVNDGASVGVRSLIIAGLILYMPEALLGLIVFIVLVSSSNVMCLSWNGGAVEAGAVLLMGCWGAMWVSIVVGVRCPMVMK